MFKQFRTGFKVPFYTLVAALPIGGLIALFPNEVLNQFWQAQYSEHLAVIFPSIIGLIILFQFLMKVQSSIWLSSNKRAVSMLGKLTEFAANACRFGVHTLSGAWPMLVIAAWLSGHRSVEGIDILVGIMMAVLGGLSELMSDKREQTAKQHRFAIWARNTLVVSFISLFSSLQLFLRNCYVSDARESLLFMQCQTVVDNPFTVYPIAIGLIAALVTAVWVGIRLVMKKRNGAVEANPEPA
ncbi:hypothetical protein [Thaumasiovibrio subtropicus]|uniref:hypothetical protein n=1 Tax=Thaumasiovibrio subtropicus TaxID=1891207 RepID=UPI00131E274B|nr:hypothetical protein [Thaumasiovibrio subtropicus]